MLVVILALSLAGSPAMVAPSEPVRICNAMQVTLDGVQFEDSNGAAMGTANGRLAPGDCADISAVPPGDYVVRFVEHGPNGEAALCARRVKVKPGDTIRISPDDGSQCIQ